MEHYSILLYNTHSIFEKIVYISFIIKTVVQ